MRPRGAMGRAIAPPRLARGWNHPHAAALTLATQTGGEPSTVIYESPTGNRLRFYQSGANFFPNVGVRASLALANNVYTLTAADQSVQEFDSTGRLLRTRDVQGHTTSTSYYTGTGQLWDGQLQQVRDERSGQTLTFSYKLVGAAVRLDRVTAAAGITVRYDYDASGRLTTVTDVMNQVTGYGYDGSSGRLARITLPDGTVQIQNSYDPITGRVSGQIEPDGTTVSYAYTSSSTGPVTTITRQKSGGVADVWVDQYRPDKTLAWQTHNDAFVAAYAFAESLAPSATVDGRGQVTTTRTTRTGLPLQQTDALSQTTTLTYTLSGLPQAMRDPLGRTTTLDYASGTADVTAVRQQSADGQLQLTTRYTYTADHLLDAQHTPDGVVTRYQYDPQGRVQTQIVGDGTPLAQTTTYERDAVGRVVTTTVGAPDLVRRDVVRYRADNQIDRTIANYQDGVFNAAQPTRMWSRATATMRAGGRSGRKPSMAASRRRPTIAMGAWPGRRRTSPGIRRAVRCLRYRRALVPPRPTPTSAPSMAMMRWAARSSSPRPASSPAASTRSRAALATTPRARPGRSTTRATAPSPGRSTTALASPQARMSTCRRGPTTTATAMGSGSATRSSAGRKPRTMRGTARSRSRRTTRTATHALCRRGTTPGPARRTRITCRSSSIAPMGSCSAPSITAWTGSSPPPSRSPTRSRSTNTTAWAAPSPPRRSSTPPTWAAYETQTATNRVTHRAYDPHTGRLLATRDVGNHWTAFQYDALGRVSTTIAHCVVGILPVPSGCDPFNPLESDRNVPTTTQYDTLGRVKATIDMRGQVTRTTYDGLGRTRFTTRNYVAGASPTADVNVITGQRYDSMGRVVATEDARSQDTTYGHDALGRTISVTDPALRTRTDGLRRRG
ncbi:hypothetical protein HC891_05780, partial [Candidatus Gracilibacteria bacterium]|nr:hypothetical protein [Candidatus Gracilibacteria bacterium]